MLDKETIRELILKTLDPEAYANEKASTKVSFPTEADLLKEGSYLFYEFKDKEEAYQFDSDHPEYGNYVKKISPLFSNNVINKNKSNWELLNIITEELPFYYREPTLENGVEDKYPLEFYRDPAIINVPSPLQDNPFYQTWFRDTQGYLQNYILLDVYNKLRWPFLNENQYLNADLFPELANKAFIAEDEDSKIEFKHTAEDNKSESGKADTVGCLDYINNIVADKLTSTYDILDYNPLQTSLLTKWSESLYYSGLLTDDDLEKERSVFKLQDIKYELLRRKFAGSSTLYNLSLSSIDRQGSFIGAIQLGSIATFDTNDFFFKDKREARIVNIPGITTEYADIDIDPISTFYTKPVQDNKCTSIKRYESLDSFPETGLSNVLYIDLSTGKKYIWSPVTNPSKLSDNYSIALDANYIPISTIVPLFYSSSKTLKYSADEFYGAFKDNATTSSEIGEIDPEYKKKRLRDNNNVIEWNALTGISFKKNASNITPTLDQYVNDASVESGKRLRHLDDIFEFEDPVTEDKESYPLRLDINISKVNPAAVYHSFLDINANHILFHKNTSQLDLEGDYPYLTSSIADNNSVSLMDYPWLNYIQNASKRKSRVQDDVRYGVQINKYVGVNNTVNTCSFIKDKATTSQFFGISYLNDDSVKTINTVDYLTYEEASITKAIVCDRFKRLCEEDEVAVADILYYKKSNENYCTYTKLNPQPAVGTSVKGYYTLPTFYEKAGEEFFPVNVKEGDLITNYYLLRYVDNQKEYVPCEKLAKPKFALLWYFEIEYISSRQIIADVKRELVSKISLIENVKPNPAPSNYILGSYNVGILPFTYQNISKQDTQSISDAILAMQYGNYDNKYPDDIQDLGYAKAYYFFSNYDINPKQDLGTRTNEKISTSREVLNKSFIINTPSMDTKSVFYAIERGEEYYWSPQIKVLPITSSASSANKAFYIPKEGLEGKPYTSDWDNLIYHFNPYLNFTKESASSLRGVDVLHSIKARNNVNAEDLKYKELESTDPEYIISGPSTNTALCNITRKRSMDSMCNDLGTNTSTYWVSADNYKDNFSEAARGIRGFYLYRKSEPIPMLPGSSTKVDIDEIKRRKSIDNELNEHVSIYGDNRFDDIYNYVTLEGSSSTEDRTAIQYDRSSDNDTLNTVYDSENPGVPCLKFARPSYLSTTTGSFIDNYYQITPCNYINGVIPQDAYTNWFWNKESDGITVCMNLFFDKVLFNSLIYPEHIKVELIQREGEFEIFADINNVNSTTDITFAYNNKSVVSHISDNNILINGNTRISASASATELLLTVNNYTEKLTDSISLVSLPIAKPINLFCKASLEGTSLEGTTEKRDNYFYGKVYDIRLYKKPHSEVHLPILNSGTIRELYSYSPEIYKLGYSIYEDLGVIKRVNCDTTTESLPKTTHIRLFNRSVWDTILVDMNPITEAEMDPNSYQYSVKNSTTQSAAPDYYDSIKDTDIWKEVRGDNITYKLTDAIQQKLNTSIEVFNSPSPTRRETYINYNNKLIKFSGTDRSTIITTSLYPVSYDNYPFISSRSKFEVVKSNDCISIKTKEGSAIRLPDAITSVDETFNYSSDINFNFKVKDTSDLSIFYSRGSNISLDYNSKLDTTAIKLLDNTSHTSQSDHVLIPLIIAPQKEDNNSTCYLDRLYLKGVELNSNLKSFLNTSNYYTEFRLPTALTSTSYEAATGVVSNSIVYYVRSGDGSKYNPYIYHKASPQPEVGTSAVGYYICNTTMQYASKWDAIRCLKEGTYYFTCKYPLEILPFDDSTYDTTTATSYTPYYASVRFKIEVKGTPVVYESSKYSKIKDPSRYYADKLNALTNSNTIDETYLCKPEDNRTYPHRQMNVDLYVQEIIGDSENSGVAGRMKYIQVGDKVVEDYLFSWKLIGSNHTSDYLGTSTGKLPSTEPIDITDSKYRLTRDVVVNSNKLYFTRTLDTSGKYYVYTKVNTPVVTDLATYYETSIISLDKLSLDDYLGCFESIPLFLERSYTTPFFLAKTEKTSSSLVYNPTSADDDIVDPIKVNTLSSAKVAYLYTKCKDNDIIDYTIEYFKNQYGQDLEAKIPESEIILHNTEKVSTFLNSDYAKQNNIVELYTRKATPEKIWSMTENDVNNQALLAGRTYKLLFDYTPRLTEFSFTDNYYSNANNLISYTMSSEEKIQLARIVNLLDENTSSEYKYTEFSPKNYLYNVSNIINRTSGFDVVKEDGVVKWKEVTEPESITAESDICYFGNPYSRSSVSNFILRNASKNTNARYCIDNSYYFTYVATEVLAGNFVAGTPYGATTISKLSVLKKDTAEPVHISFDESKVLRNYYSLINNRVVEAKSSLINSSAGLLTALSNISPSLKKVGAADSTINTECVIDSNSYTLYASNYKDKNILSKNTGIDIERRGMYSNNLIRSQLYDNRDHWSLDNAYKNDTYNQVSTSWYSDSTWQNGKDVYLLKYRGLYDPSSTAEGHIVNNNTSNPMRFEYVTGTSSIYSLRYEVAINLKCSDIKKLSVYAYCFDNNTNIDSSKIYKYKLTVKDSSGEEKKDLLNNTWYTFEYETTEPIKCSNVAYIFEIKNSKNVDIYLTKAIMRKCEKIKSHKLGLADCLNENNNTISILGHNAVIYQHKTTGELIPVLFKNKIIQVPTTSTYGGSRSLSLSSSDIRESFINNYKITPNSKSSELKTPWLKRFCYDRSVTYTEKTEGTRSYLLPEVKESCTFHSYKRGEDSSEFIECPIAENSVFNKETKATFFIEDGIPSLSLDLKMSNKSIETITGYNMNLILNESNPISLSEEKFSVLTNCFNPDKYRAKEDSTVTVTNIQLLGPINPEDEEDTSTQVLYELEYLPIVYNEKEHHFTANIFLHKRTE